MKIVIVSPPKSGANRLRCLLATLYGLRAVDARDAPAGDSPADVARWLETLPHNCVTHTELYFDPALISSAVDLGVTFIAIVRHPLDLFVSNREVWSHRNQRASRRSRVGDSADAGTPARPAVDPEYSRDSFAADVQTLLDWSTSAAATVRYEDILDLPEVVLTVLAPIFGNLDGAKIARAVMLCPAEQRIVSSGNRGVRMTELPPGSWQIQLEPEAMVQLQSQTRHALASLGYEPSHTS